MSEKYFQHTFENGLTLLGEEMPGMHSAAMTMLVPAGSSGDPETTAGSATVLADLILRGAGARDNRALTEHLDSLGLQRGSGVGIYHTRLGCAAPADKVIAGLPAFADILLRPHLPADGFTAARDLVRQSLAGIEDEPRQKLNVKLRELYFPWPLGRNALGSEQSLNAMSLDSVKRDWKARYSPRSAIFAFAGKINFDDLVKRISDLFATWNEPLPPASIPRPASGNYLFVQQETEQTHIGLAWPTVDEANENYYAARIVYDILGGGMSSRLFTEVREKRALCYNVSAGYASLKGLGCVMGYAGSSNDRAQATLDCFVEEIRKLSDGIKLDELDRAKVGLKANTIMSGESTSARAGAIAHDFFMRGRIRTIDEIKAGIDAVTLDRANAFLASSNLERPTIVVLGPKELRMN